MIKYNGSDNHSSAREFPSAVDEYIYTELKQGSLLGPFIEPPHDNYIWSPLMTRPKGEGRRVILDLSFGSHSVNKNTETSLYDGMPFALKLLNLDSVLQQLERFDQDARLFKGDISLILHLHLEMGAWAQEMRFI